MNMSVNNINDGCKIRKCSFRPEDYLVTIVQNDGSNAKYLLVQDRVLWFQMYCAENGVKGLIDDSNIEYIPQLKMFRATCIITMNGEIVGKSSGSCVYAEDKLKALECAATSAKGRALANAGFGTAMCYQDDPDVGQDNQCDAGVKMPDRWENQSDVSDEGQDNPMMSEQPLIPAAMATQDKILPSTLAEAQGIILEIKNSPYNGKTLGEINALNSGYIRWLAESYNPRKHPEYKEGAKIIMNNVA